MGPFSKINYLLLEANSYCNLHCVTCNRDELVEAGLRNLKNMSLDELRTLINQLKDCPLETIKFQGISEPMFHPQFHILTKELKSHFPKASILIATNLQYSLEKTPFLETLPYVDMVYLSIDGAKENYERQRVGAKWSRLQKSLSSIQQHVSEKDRKEKLHINFVLTPENYRDLPAMYELKSEYGLASVRINLAQDWDETRLNAHKFDSEIITFLKSYKKDLKGVGGWQYSDCFWPFNGISIDVFGDVRQCIVNTTQTPLGNAFKTPLEEIYNSSPRYQQTRQALMKNRPASSCVTCDYKHLSPILAQIFEDDKFSNAPRKPVYGFLG